MDITIVGSIKIDSKSRKSFFFANLESLKTVSDLFSWNFNIVGRYADVCAEEIKKRHRLVMVTHDDASSYYEVVNKQLSSFDERGADQILFFLQEDHWLICPHNNIFLYLLEEFNRSTARVLRVTHLTEFWEKQSLFKILSQNPLYKECEIDLQGYAKMLKIEPAGYITSLPGIFKRSIAREFLDHNKELLSKEKGSLNFELYGAKAEEFLRGKSFVSMIPSLHVLREVFLVNELERSMDADKAVTLIKMRDSPDGKLGPLREIMDLVNSPRIMMRRIKRRFKK